MGDILLNVGQFTSEFLPALRARLATETIVGHPSGLVEHQPEIVATLAMSPDQVGELLLPSVRWVHVLGAGIDGFPLDRLDDRVLTCAKGASAVPIAEYVLAAILASAKDLPRQWIHEPPLTWNSPAGGPLRSLVGETVVLIGVGEIGTEVARRALAFGMRVVGLRRSATPMPLPEIEVAESLAGALGIADHIVVSAPSTAATHHLIGSAALQHVKPGAHLINVARGELVDSSALIAALDEGTLARASLDVAEGEPLAAGNPLFDHPRVHLTPHISWSSQHTGATTIERFAANVERWRAGAPLRGRVDPAMGY